MTQIEMQEKLRVLLDGLRKSLVKKTALLSEAGKTNSGYAGYIVNSEKMIAIFEFGIKEVTNDPTQRQNIVANFTKDAKDIHKYIDAI